MVDGISGNQLYRLVFDASPEPAEAAADTWLPDPDPGTVDLTLDALGQLARVPVDQLRMLLRALRTPNALTQSLEDTLRGLAALARSFAPAAPSSVLGPIGAARRYAVGRAPMTDLTTVAKAFRVTVNDVYLAAVTGAFRGLMVARGEEPAPGAVRTLVPVNVRVPRDEAVLDNHVSMMLLDLPISATAQPSA